MVLALIAERASGADYHDLVRTRVSEPAGMSDTDFLRSDELPGRTALGYLSIDGTWRTNVFHLSVHWHRRLAGSTPPSPTSVVCGRRCSPAASSAPTR